MENHDLNLQLIRLTHELKRFCDLLELVPVWFRPHADASTKQDLKEMEKRILMNAQQLEALLNNQTTQIGKIAKEQSDRFDAVTAANKALQAAIDAGGVTPAIETAAGNLQTALDNLDASIPDAPVPPVG